jgi:hypothetical protein
MTRIAAVFLCLALSEAAVAQMKLEVVPIRVDKSGVTRYSDSSGGYDVDRTWQKLLKVTVRNLGSKTFNGTVEACFFGNAKSGGKRAYPLVAKQDHVIALAPGASEEYIADSGIITRRTLNLNLIGIYENHGFDLNSWAIVLRSAHGEAKKVRCSAKPLESEIARRDLSEEWEAVQRANREVFGSLPGLDD